MEQQSVEITGQRIAYLDSAAGRDRPAVIFVHGNSSSARTWLPVLDGSFGQEFRCLALDLPGHGHSAQARDQASYSLPGYAAVLAGFAKALGAADAVVVGWSLGGHIALEAAPAMPEAAGFVIFGTPPVASPAQFAEAFLPNPAMNVGFTAERHRGRGDRVRGQLHRARLCRPGRRVRARHPGHRRRGARRAARQHRRRPVRRRGGDRRGAPPAACHPARRSRELVSLDYLRGLTIPALWRGEVQLIPGRPRAAPGGPQRFAALLTEFIADLDR